ncbi:LysE/ArgO family amino acid transporter [Pseudoclavibacter alba]|uniref:LysE/ArgO family amino acid transporter n=1 Tax=Pseudoclavibacter albus TaxID=272241 RepID=A0ABT2HXD5_9MICO|nr:LysE/ArgO family amino acid transporter [Pseudoclavibacter alba]MCT2042970.1 LysE/ArgO family amino acid transporter [Pseudoclavibacter alba]
MIPLLLSGTLTGLALIVAIGAQNAFLLRQGIRREHLLEVVLVCILGDVLLITAGTAGIGIIVEAVPWLLEVLRWAGVLYLVWFAISSFRSAARPGTLEPEAPASRGSIVLTALAITFLNPHVYLDTVVLLGSLANQHGPSDRWVFAGGAILGSVIWFTGLGFGARLLAKVLDKPSTWRVVDLVVGVVMLGLAIKLALGL